MTGQKAVPAKCAAHTFYRVVPGGRSPDEFVVATGTPDEPGPAVVTGFATREAAQAEADRLNALAEAFEGGDDQRRDEVLGRMLRPKRI